MRVSMIKEKKIKDIILPNNVEGSYWLSDNDSNGIKKNLISIEADNGKWKLVSNKEVYYIEQGVMQPFVYLQPGGFYYIRNDLEDRNILIYCSSVLTEYNYYDVNSALMSGIVVGHGTSSLVDYPFMESSTVVIKKENNQLYLYDYGFKYGVYVNNVRIPNRKEIKLGDIIFLLGLKIIFVARDNTYYMCVNKIHNVTVNLMATGFMAPLNTSFYESEEELVFPIYEESEYFHKTPRFVSTVKPLMLQVDPPPAKIENQENSLLLTIGPMLTMSMTSMVTGYMAISNVTSGSSTWKQAIPSLVICGAMMASVLIWPMFSRWYEKKTRKKNEAMRQKKYSDYIESKRVAIVNAKTEQSQILLNSYPSLKDSVDTILNRYTTLWQRRIEDEDYLCVNLGSGSYPMQIEIKYPEDHFSMVEDNLKDMVSTLGSEPKLLSNVPVVFSFMNYHISSLIGHGEVVSEYMRRLLIQIVAFHSYDDLKIVVLTDEENEYNWKFLKDMPHCFSDDKSIRFFATNNDEYKEVCYYLDTIFDLRKEHLGTQEPKAEDFDKTYLIITDNFKKVRDYEIIDEILSNKKSYGFSLFILDEKITNLPDQCNSFIQIEGDKGEFHSDLSSTETTKFSIDFVTPVDYELCTTKLANVPIEINNNEEGQLPSKIGFLEMYDVGKIEQLNVLSRWQQSNPMLNLQVPVGIGKNGEKVSIDLHEKYHGPHGLVAGMTGSGKSEFIITYILSMAINYHPYEVQFILIDYKGGGLAGAFENQSIGLKLPHLVGTITNLDANEINRSLASIESELKRRQALFNKAREVSGESTIDIYKYQKMYRDGLIEEPVSHLFIISDEFAELKNQQPEFMDQLISTARIGRSLGVHLILATQKPSGVVDPQIWSNTRFRVCMRVQDKSDSNEVIKCPDAAYLKQTGRFYFQVGYNEVFVLAQAAWAGGKYIPAERVNKTIDTSLEFIDNIGYPVKKVETREKKEVSTTAQGEELLNIVRYLSGIAIEQNIHCRPLWLEKISEDIRIENLAQKYQYTKEAFVVNPIIGEYDIPSNQEQRILTLPLSKEGNATVFGASGSGKENFVTTMIYSSMLYYKPEELNYYIIDFGSGALKMFKDCPLVGDILTVDDEEKINNLYKMLTVTINERKELFSEYNGDYVTYCKNSGKTVPNIVVIINNYESYQETYGDLDDTLIVLSRDCIRYGVYFVINVNTPNGMRFKLRQNFAQTFVLQQNSEDDYVTILGSVHKTYPARLFGRGIIKTDDVYEFQTAMVTEKDHITQFIKDACSKYNSKCEIKANPIPTLPNVVSYKDIASSFGKVDGLIIGIDKMELDVVTFDFNKNFATIVSSLDIESSQNFINPLINQTIALNRSSLVVINAEDYYIDDKYKGKYNYVDQDFNDIFDSLSNFAKEQHSLYVQSNYDKKIFEGKRPITCFIIGIDSFKNKLSDENKLRFGDLFTNLKDLGIAQFIIVDSIDRIKNNEFDTWYKSCINNTMGIWIGNGINDQFSLKISQKIEEMREEVPDGFCFVISRGKPIYVKYVEKFELKI